MLDACRSYDYIIDVKSAEMKLDVEFLNKII